MYNSHFEFEQSLHFRLHVTVTQVLQPHDEWGMLKQIVEPFYFPHVLHSHLFKSQSVFDINFFNISSKVAYSIRNVVQKTTH